MTAARPLAGLRIADFTWIGAGAFATKIFSDLGADVIKIESRARIDQLRQARPFRDGVPGLNRSGYFADRNSSKRSVTLNLNHPRARELARKLISMSDIVANNFTPGVMEKFGLGYADVVQFKPEIVYLAMSMQGQSGPESRYLGFGLTMGALTGLHNLCGNPDRNPIGTGTNFPDHVPCPTHAAFATLAALRHRRRTGRGQMIDLAQIEPTIALLGPAVLQFTANGQVAQRTGNEREGRAPHGVYPCAGEDRWIAIAASGSAQWQGLLHVFDDDTLAADPRFATDAARWTNREALDQALARLTAHRDGARLMRDLQSAGVPAGMVQHADDLLRHDPQLAHREHWSWLDHPEMGRSVYSALPFRFSASDTAPTSPAPLIGQHTDEVCHDLLGLSSEEIAGLRASGALD